MLVFGYFWDTFGLFLVSNHFVCFACLLLVKICFSYGFEILLDTFGILLDGFLLVFEYFWDTFGWFLVSFWILLGYFWMVLNGLDRFLLVFGYFWNTFGWI